MQVVESLKRLNLRIMNSFKHKFSIFQAISFFYFSDPHKEAKLEKMAVDFLKKCFKDNYFPYELRGLEKNPNILQIYL